MMVESKEKAATAATATASTHQGIENKIQVQDTTMAREKQEEG